MKRTALFAAVMLAASLCWAQTPTKPALKVTVDCGRIVLLPELPDTAKAKWVGQQSVPGGTWIALIWQDSNGELQYAPYTLPYAWSGDAAPPAPIPVPIPAPPAPPDDWAKADANLRAFVIEDMNTRTPAEAALVKSLVDWQRQKDGSSRVRVEDISVFVSEDCPPALKSLYNAVKDKSAPLLILESGGKAKAVIGLPASLDEFKAAWKKNGGPNL
jgi:hypothetical protein